MLCIQPAVAPNPLHLALYHSMRILVKILIGINCVLNILNCLKSPGSLSSVVLNTESIYWILLYLSNIIDNIVYRLLSWKKYVHNSMNCLQKDGYDLLYHNITILFYFLQRKKVALECVLITDRLMKILSLMAILCLALMIYWITLVAQPFSLSWMCKVVITKW